MTPTVLIVLFAPLVFFIWCLPVIIAMKRAKPDPYECPESPLIPPPIRKSLSTRDRLALAEDLRERRAQWEARQEIDRLCADIASGREP